MSELGSSDNDQVEPHRVAIGAVIEHLQPEFPDVSVSKIRFLESRGLVTPWRSESGFRRFDDADIARLRWILTMQRDHFLPLRVIKERLESGALDTAETADRRSEAPTAVAGHSRFGEAKPADLETADIVRLAAIDETQLDSLINFGILDAAETPDGRRFSHDELRVAQAASAFLRRGIEARHLKAWRIAAEREAGMVEQIVMPITHQTSADAPMRARQTADELIDMGNTIREAIMVKVLRRGLGPTD